MHRLSTASNASAVVILKKVQELRKDGMCIMLKRTLQWCHYLFTTASGAIKIQPVAMATDVEGKLKWFNGKVRCMLAIILITILDCNRSHIMEGDCGEWCEAPVCAVQGWRSTLDWPYINMEANRGRRVAGDE